MITKENERMSVGGGFLSVEEFYGLSTDAKPTNTANGSTFFEMDTGKMYRFNFSGTTWTETTHYGSDGFGPAPSGGGGGSSGGGVLVVHDIYDEQTDTSTLDKTWQEIVDADFAVMRGEGNDMLYVCPMVHAFVLNGAYYVLFCRTQPGEGAVPYQELTAYSTNTANGYPVYVDIEGDDA